MSPSTQTLIQAAPPLIVTTRFTPLYATDTCRVSVADDVSFEALTVIVHWPVVSWSGVSPVSHDPSVTGIVNGAGPVPPPAGAPLAPGVGFGLAAGAGSPATGPSYVAVTVTEVAFVARPWTGIAPFSKTVPSAGLSMSSVGPCAWLIGTVITTWAGVSVCLPVSGSVASIVNVFRPRRTSTVALHAPVESADTWRVPPAISIVIVAPGIDLPSNVYEVAVSSSWRVASRGDVIERVGGFAKRWT